MGLSRGHVGPHQRPWGDFLAKEILRVNIASHLETFLGHREQECSRRPNLLFFPCLRHAKGGGHPGTVMGHSRLEMPPQGKNIVPLRVLNGFETVRAHCGAILGPSGGHLGPILSLPRPILEPSRSFPEAMSGHIKDNGANSWPRKS